MTEERYRHPGGELPNDEERRIIADLRARRAERERRLRSEGWTEGFIAGVNAADAARNGVWDLYDKYCRNPYERNRDE